VSPPPLLQVERLTRDYRAGLFGGGPARRALDRVSLTVRAGEIVGILGESGCGKSTLARLVVALDRPTAGRVLLQGEALFDLPRKLLARRRRDFQMVFQDPYGSLDPRQTVGRIVAEPLHVLDPRPSRHDEAARVAAMLESVGLRPDHAAHYPHEFSGGQRQRIAIARALITHPKLVVADEPVSALDLSVQAQVLNLLLDLRDRHGTAFLFISHDLAVVDAVADRVAVMIRGRIVETGPAAALFDAPLHPYTRLLLEAGPALEAAARRSTRPGAVDSDAPADWNGCAFRSRCRHATEQCSLEAPALRDATGDRTVACHHAEIPEKIRSQ
jgi:oligopeptide/dipeptide ABC transporter ATP-binding protein